MTTDSFQDSQKYSAKAIRVLKGLEGVRARPDMYIGNTQDGSGLHRMVFELIDNSVDEFPHCNIIKIHISKDETVTVEDNGRGIPTDMHPGENRPALEVIFTELHSGGKFEDSNEAYRCSGGLHGLGASIVNALSTKLTATIWRNGREYSISFVNGIKERDMASIPLDDPSKTGTKISFTPSPEIFGKSSNLDYNILLERINEIGYLNSGLTLILEDEASEKSNKIHCQDGLLNFLTLIRKQAEPICEPIRIESKSRDCSVSVILQWVETHYENGLCFTNFVRQKEGGAHLTGFRSAITRVINKFIDEHPEDIKKLKIDSVIGEDMRDGLNYIISLRLAQPKFSSQTKDKLVNEEARSSVDFVVSSQLSIWLEEHPIATVSIIKKILMAASAREAAKRAKDAARKTKIGIDSFTLPGKLAGCREKDPRLTELFIVEGDSAGGPAKAARMRETQAVLPVRGKILNVEKTNQERALGSDAVKSILASVGTGIGDQFDINSLRYGKIILMADADVDGAHIRTLILTLFYRYMKQVIENGHLYVAKPPLYRVKDRNKSIYIDNEAQLTHYTLSVASEVIKMRDKDFREVPSGMPKDVYFMSDIIYREIHKRNAELDEIVLLASEVVHFVFTENNWSTATISDLEYSSNNDNDVAITKHEIDSRINSALQKRAPEYTWTIISHPTHVELSAKDSLGCITNIIVQIKDRVIEYMTKNIAKYVATEKEYEGKYLRHKDRSTKIRCLSSIAQMANIAAKDVLQINRFKGLGEMQVAQLWETAMNPETRKLIRVTIEDSQEAEAVFAKLMGSEAENRRIFIEEYVPLENLEIDI